MRRRVPDALALKVLQGEFIEDDRVIMDTSGASIVFRAGVPRVDEGINGCSLVTAADAEDSGPRAQAAAHQAPLLYIDMGHDEGTLVPMSEDRDRDIWEC